MSGGVGREDPGVDRALRLTVPSELAETAGAVLMDLLGPFEEQPGRDATTLVFYPACDPATGEPPPFEDVLATLPAELRASGRVQIETRDVSRDWVDGWKDHFRPIVIGRVRIRPPWEPALESAAPGGTGLDRAAPDGAAPDGAGLVDVVINPGLGFGTGLHATTRGTLQLLQRVPGGRAAQGQPLGPVVDAGTGSGILAIAAAKLGWGPVFAFDNDPVALISARENVEANAVQGVVEIDQADIQEAAAAWFAGATVLANMTLAPVTALLRRLALLEGPWSGGGVEGARPARVVVSGILSGPQEVKLLDEARLHGLAPGERIYEDEWVSMEFAPAAGGHAVSGGAGGGESAGARPRGA